MGTLGSRSTKNRIRQPPTRDLRTPARSVSGAGKRGAKGRPRRVVELHPWSQCVDARPHSRDAKCSGLRGHGSNACQSVGVINGEGVGMLASSAALGRMITPAPRRVPARPPTKIPAKLRRLIGGGALIFLDDIAQDGHDVAVVDAAAEAVDEERGEQDWAPVRIRNTAASMTRKVTRREKGSEEREFRSVIALADGRGSSRGQGWLAGPLVFKQVSGRRRGGCGLGRLRLHPRLDGER